MEHMARACVLIAVDGVIYRAFAVSDSSKPEAGIPSCSMVICFAWATATAMARDAEIKQGLADTDPGGEKLKELKTCRYA